MKFCNACDKSYCTDCVTLSSCAYCSGGWCEGCDMKACDECQDDHCENCLDCKLGTVRKDREDACHDCASDVAPLLLRQNTKEIEEVHEQRTEIEGMMCSIL